MQALLGILSVCSAEELEEAPRGRRGRKAALAEAEETGLRDKVLAVGRMQKIFQEIQSWQFAREFVLENQSGKPGFTSMRRQEAEHEIESVGKDLRAMFSWLKKV